MAEEADDKLRCGAQRVGKPKGTLCKQIVSEIGAKCFHHRTDDKPYLKTHTLLAKGGPKLPKTILELSRGPVSDAARKLLRVKINTARTAVKDDRPGFVYVYYLKDDDSAWYWKIGCTARKDPDVRLSEWPGAVKRLVVQVKANKLCETLVHAVLSDYRLFRYVFSDSNGGKSYLTEEVASKRTCRDKAYARLAAIPPADTGVFIGKLGAYTRHVWEQVRDGAHRVKMGTRTKEIEWFNAPFDDIRLVVVTVAHAVNRWVAALGRENEDEKEEPKVTLSV